MSELKRCPFCGGEAEITINKTRQGQTSVVRCTKCTCRKTLLKYPFYEGDIYVDAVKDWNTRKPMERIVERLEEYRDDFMNDVYEELREDADNCRANRIIDRFDEVTEILKEEGGMNEKVQ